MALFESYERRVDKINAVLAEYGINSIEECRAICKEKGFDPYEIVKGVQPIAFENAGWAYCVGAAIAITTILGYSAMAGIVGGGGLGDIAIRYGYYRYETGIMIVTVVLLVVVVQIFQEIGMRLASHEDKRK